jgi:hypothetical protein
MATEFFPNLARRSSTSDSGSPFSSVPSTVSAAGTSASETSISKGASVRFPFATEREAAPAAPDCG